MEKYRTILISISFMIALFSNCYDKNIIEAPNNEQIVNTLPLTTIFEIDGKKYKHYVFTNINFKDDKADNFQYENAVFLIHGLSYDAKNQYEIIKTAVRHITQLDKTVIISPLFKEKEDSSDDIYWGSGYRIGNYARNVEISSFGILDYYIQEYLMNKSYFPNMKRIIICGHSAGGQLVHRYAASNLLDVESGEIAFSYVVSNPSSYLYPRPERWNNTTSSWSIPEGCSSYNSYHYGLDNLNAYLKNTTKSVIEEQFPNRKVNYLLGEQDLSASDKSCEAMWQEGIENPASTYSGNRFKRGNIMFQFFEHFYPNHTHHLDTVPYVGHDSYEIFTSNKGEEVLERLFTN